MTFSHPCKPCTFSAGWLILDDTYVGEYDENSIDTLLESGTTYEYTFVQKEEQYELAEVSLMSVE